MSDRSFGVFILSGGRPDNVRTIETLRTRGYTGRWWIVNDDEDASSPEYVKRYGDRVLTFSKSRYRAETDEMDNFGSGKVVVYARNACWDLAASLGLTHFLVLDDDYLNFEIRLDHRGVFGYWRMGDLDAAIEAFCDWLDETPALSIAMAQGGDWIGGKDNSKLRSCISLRKVMNSFFCRTDRPFKFPGRINEDVNAYVTLGSQGAFFYTHMAASLVQVQTQAQKGGLTGAYLEAGTYCKSFYSVMGSPSCVHVYAMGETHHRLHHRVSWGHAVPMVIRERHRKQAEE